MGKTKVTHFENECLLAMGRRDLKYLNLKPDSVFSRLELDRRK